jgi:hypothetical protein
MPSLKEQWEATPLWQRVVVAVMLPLVAVGAVWFYVIKPDMERKERLIKEKKQLTQEIAKYKRLIRPGALKSLESQLEKLKKEEEAKKKELERVVGKIPTQEEIEKVFGEINQIAVSRDLIITRIALSPPKVQNLQLIEKDGKKLIKPVAQASQRQQPRRRGRKKAPPQRSTSLPGVPVTTMEVAMELEGTAKNIYSFLKAIHKKGLISYPKSVSIKPIKDKGRVSASVVIDVILQK